VNEKPTHLDLFSGIGGFALAAKWAGFKTVGFCEIDKYCQRILAKNFLADARCECLSVGRNPCDMAGEARAIKDHGKERQRVWNSARNGRPIICGNIFSLDGKAFAGVDLITGGFPCQPFSVAGKRKGAADDRHLWPEMLRIIKEARPAWVLGENVPGIIPMELDNVLSSLESLGYACRAFTIPACAVDARHRRDRLWIVAHAERSGGSRRPARSANSNGAGPFRETERPSGIPNAFGARLEKQQRERCHSQCQAAQRNGDERARWQPEPDVGRVAHGIPARVDRLKGLGNAIVPQVAYEIMRAIRERA
jgi:DNA (cytosine-5)-methyltransferase 1